jgi:pathogenesis-related protein 1
MEKIWKVGWVVTLTVTGLLGGELTSQEIKEGLKLMNQLRAEVKISPLRWSEKLARNAQAWAEKLANSGQFKHSETHGKYGENIFVAWGKRPVTLKDAVLTWGAEKVDYLGGAIRSKNYCKPGKMCGHYTQIVWKTTTEVGCGKAIHKGRTYIVCQFAPPGNYLGRKPY